MEPTAKQPLIQLRKVRVTYDEGKPSEMTALHEIDLEIYEGEYIVFLGPSGCGKSTLLYTIAGLEIPTSGQVVVAGKALGQITPMEKIEFYRTTIGMIFQAFYLVAHLTAADNIMLAGMFAGHTPADRRAKADMLMQRFGITTYADRKPSNMSGGQQQRTAIARALMNDPHIILADEPVGNLDSKNALTVLELLADIHRDEGKTVIQVTHNANDARYADRVFYMKDGKVEKVVVNAHPDRGANAGPGAVPPAAGELAKLAAENPNLSEAELHSLLIMRAVFLPYTLDVEHSIVTAIRRYIAGETTLAQLSEELDARHGGAGLYSPTARHGAREIERLWNEIKSLAPAGSSLPDQGKGKPDAVSLRLRADSAAGYLLESYRGKVTPEQRRAIVAAVSDRLAGVTDPAAFAKALEAKDGARLHPRTAAKFAQELDVLISK